MKKAVSFLFSLALLTAVTIKSVEACSGTYYASDYHGAIGLMAEANQNCCAGSQITIEDFYGNSVTHTVQFNGSNALCL